MSINLGISTDIGTLCYAKYGSGPQILIAFHGFGQNKGVYKPLSEVLIKYTIYSFDLFFHGDSKYNIKNSPLTPSSFVDLINIFLRKENIKRFSLVGFSMGAKFALLVTQTFGSSIDHLILIAPDGIVPNFWYRFATGTILTRSFYKEVVFRPKYFFQLLEFANLLKLASPSTLKFAKNQMDTRSKRWQVYFSWMVFRNVITPFNMVLKKQQKEQFRLIIFLGNQDMVIPASKIKKKFRVNSTIEIVELDSRHGPLLVKTIEYIKNNNLFN